MPSFLPYLNAYGILASLASSKSAEHILTPNPHSRAQEVINRQRSKRLNEISISVPVGRENGSIQGDNTIEFVL
jgi:hypothetical protein